MRIDLENFIFSALLFYVGASGDVGLKKVWKWFCFSNFCSFSSAFRQIDQVILLFPRQHYKLVTDQTWTELNQTRFEVDNNCCGPEEEPGENCAAVPNAKKGRPMMMMMMLVTMKKIMMVMMADAIHINVTHLVCILNRVFRCFGGIV